MLIQVAYMLQKSKNESHEKDHSKWDQWFSVVPLTHIFFHVWLTQAKRWVKCWFRHFSWCWAQEWRPSLALHVIC